jgi:hypothetical protein
MSKRGKSVDFVHGAFHVPALEMQSESPLGHELPIEEIPMLAGRA